MHVFSGGREDTKTAGANSVRGGGVDGGGDLPACVMALQTDGTTARDLCKRPTTPLCRPIALGTTWKLVHCECLEELYRAR